MCSTPSWRNPQNVGASAGSAATVTPPPVSPAGRREISIPSSFALNNFFASVEPCSSAMITNCRCPAGNAPSWRERSVTTPGCARGKTRKKFSASPAASSTRVSLGAIAPPLVRSSKICGANPASNGCAATNSACVHFPETRASGGSNCSASAGAKPTKISKPVARNCPCAVLIPGSCALATPHTPSPNNTATQPRRSLFVAQKIFIVVAFTALRLPSS